MIVSCDDCINACVKIYYALPAQHCVPSASIENGMAAVTNEYIKNYCKWTREGATACYSCSSSLSSVAARVLGLDWCAVQKGVKHIMC